MISAADGRRDTTLSEVPRDLTAMAIARRIQRSKGAVETVKTQSAQESKKKMWVVVDFSAFHATTIENPTMQLNVRERRTI